MEQQRKNQYRRGETVPMSPGSSAFIIPRPVPDIREPYNMYRSFFAVQHVQKCPFDRQYVMISGMPQESDWAGTVKLPDGNMIRFEAVDYLEYGEGVHYIILRLNTKSGELQALAVKDYTKVPKGCLQRCLAVIDDRRIEQVACTWFIDFTVPEAPFDTLPEDDE